METVTGIQNGGKQRRNETNEITEGRIKGEIEVKRKENEGKKEKRAQETRKWNEGNIFREKI